MKKLLVVGAILAAGSMFVLSACSGCAGCGAATSNALALRSNWFAQVTTKTIQPTLIEGNTNFKSENITYDVSIDPATARNTSYSVDYDEGTYETTFYAKTFPTTLIDADFLSTYPQNAFDAYYFKTSLSIPTVTYTYKATGVTKVVEGDKVETECYFLSAGNQLRPLYSKQTIVSSTPANFTPSSVDSMYMTVDRIYENFYEFSGARVKSKTTVNPNDYSHDESSTKTVDKDASATTFDYSTLAIALRSLNLSSSLSQSINLYSPENGVQSFRVTGSNAALGEAERTTFTSELKRNNLYKDKTDLGEGEKNEVNTVAVSVALSAATYTGTSQTMWFAAVENIENNTGRATLLKMSTPLAYSLGTINYTLKDIKSTFYMG